MRTISIVLVVATMVVGLVGVAVADESNKEAKTQTTCPVMDGPVDKSSAYVDVEGKRIYVCCEGCVSAIKKDPERYIKKLEDDGVVLEKAEIRHESSHEEHSEHDHHDH